MLMLKRADDIILHEGLGSLTGTKGANSKIDSLRELGLCVCACVCVFCGHVSLFLECLRAAFWRTCATAGLTER